ncbi:MAG TPA: hypothetical protein VK802_28840 [Streptosporangiaceae bacterium]|nr:hypothetical protein [Streptosporangiaceae bacterium]
MNPGGEPERDDTGLPPVDLEVPDDARDLDRDVQAYYREQRAWRRQQRGRRLRGSLARDGILLPLLACCLILALITGTLLTVFTATSDQILPGPAGGKAAARPSAASSGAASGAATSGAASGAGSAGASGAAQAAGAPKPDVVPGVLPDATMVVAAQLPRQVQDLRRAALVLIPANCNCTPAVSWIIHVATGAHARPYLVYTGSTEAAVDGLYRTLPSSQRAQATLALDADGLLRDSVEESLPADGLAAIVIGTSKVGYATMLRSDDDPTTLIRYLTH